MIVLRNVENIKDLEISSIKELVNTKEHVYVVGIETHNAPKEIVSQLMANVKKVFEKQGLENAVLYPVVNGEPTLKISEIIKE